MFLKSQRTEFYICIIITNYLPWYLYVKVICVICDCYLKNPKPRSQENWKGALTGFDCRDTNDKGKHRVRALNLETCCLWSPTHLLTCEKLFSLSGSATSARYVNTSNYSKILVKHTHKKTRADIKWNQFGGLEMNLQIIRRSLLQLSWSEQQEKTSLWLAWRAGRKSFNEGLRLQPGSLQKQVAKLHFFTVTAVMVTTTPTCVTCGKQEEASFGITKRNGHFNHQNLFSYKKKVLQAGSSF